MLTWNNYSNASKQEKENLLLVAVQQAHNDFLAFNLLLDMLAFHGETAVLSQLVQDAWTHIQTAETLSTWQKQAFSTQACDHIIFHHLQTKSSSITDLQQHLALFYPFHEQQLHNYVTALSRGSGHSWQLLHFYIDDPTPETNKQASQNIAVLMIDFLAYLHQEEQIGYAKGNFIRHSLPIYFVERRTGQLEPRQDLAAAMRGQRPRPIIRPKAHPLCPDKVTLEKFFANQLNYQPHPYDVVATFTLIPAWLRFLQQQQLITSKEQDETLMDLQTIVVDLEQHFTQFKDDPTLVTAVHNWRAEL